MGRFDKKLATVDGLKKKLDSIRPLNKGILDRLREDFMIGNTYNSNAIEGNTLTERETMIVIKEGVTISGKSMREHMEAVGHMDALEFVASLADKKEPLTEWQIRQIHSLVLIDDAKNKGVYRPVPVTIRGASHQPPEPYLIAPQMEALMAEYENIKKEKHIIEAVAEFHLRFEGIHPFIDGNGRTGRLIINLEMMKAGYLPVDIKFADRDKYYKCFDSFFGPDESSDLLTEMIVGYETEELERYLKIVEYASGAQGKRENF